MTIGKKLAGNVDWKGLSVWSFKMHVAVNLAVFPKLFSDFLSLFDWFSTSPTHGRWRFGYTGVLRLSGTHLAPWPPGVWRPRRWKWEPNCALAELGMVGSGLEQSAAVVRRRFTFVRVCITVCNNEDAFTLLVGWQEWHPTCKKSCVNNLLCKDYLMVTLGPSGGIQRNLTRRTGLQILVRPSVHSRHVMELISWSDMVRCNLFMSKVPLNTSQPTVEYSQKIGQLNNWE